MKRIKKINIFLCILSVLLGILNEYYKFGKFNIRIELIYNIILSAIILNILYIIFRNGIAKIVNYKSKNKNKFLEKIFEKKNNLFIIALIIMLCWLPVLIMLYPGTAVNDTWGELQQIINLQNNIWNISAHHPVFDTFTMATIILPIVYYTKNWHLALFFFVIIQAIITSTIFSYSIKYAKEKLELNNICCLILLLLYCFFPVFPLCVQTIGKDSIFSCFFVLFFLQYIEVIRSNNNYLNDKKNILYFIITSIFCILSKKVAFYVILLSLLPIIFLFKSNKKIIIAIMLLLTLINVGYIPVMYKTLNILPGGKQEMFSLPFQQTAMYVINNEKKITKKEIKIIDKVINYYSIKDQYHYNNADYVKGGMQKGNDSDYSNYINLWFKQGLKDPISYINATNCMLSGWFSLHKYKPLTNMSWHNQLNNKLIPEKITKRNSFFSSTSKIVNKIYDIIYKIPIIDWILSFVSFSTIIPVFSIAILCYNKRNRLYCSLIPICLSVILGCWLAPVSTNIEGVRYLYPIVYCTPIIMMLCFYSIKAIGGVKNEKRK